ncbi:mechanosensitive ion channel family protein [Candidatus Micrarchaeota archaeon]|nr:mechanosensitive ion channel family protein [Candidatus Micrarchaeota archaeon]
MTTANTTQNLSILEPYIDHSFLEKLSAADPMVVSLSFIIVSFVVATIALGILKIITGQVAKRTKTELDDKLLEATQKPVFRLIIIGGLYLAVLNLGLENGATEVIPKIIITVAYLIVVLFIVNVLEVIVTYGLRDLAKRTDSMLDDEIIPIFHKTALVIVWAFGLILVLGAWGVDVGPFLAGLGIAGLAVSFALQNTLSNVFAGISLIIDKTFRVGDKIQLDSGEVGTVHEISLRSTRVKTYDNEIIIIPNSVLAQAKIKNFTQPDLKIRVVVPFSVEYGNKPEKVIKLIEGAIEKEIKEILEDPPVSVIFTEMGASSLNFQARFWISHYENAFAKKAEANDLIYNTLGKNKIGIPFPTQTVYVKK